MSDLESYLQFKRALMAAALAYADCPTEGQAYALRVAARSYRKARVRAGIKTPLAEET